MKLVYFGDFRLGVLKGDAVVDVVVARLLFGAGVNAAARVAG